MSVLAGKNVVLGVTGGIAAYKAAELCRLLSKAGAVVRVVMTEAATRFITPLTMQTLSGATVSRDLFDADEESRIGHIRLGDDADLIVVAPATADSIARFASGRADDLLAALILASKAPVLLAPAMNVNMWQNQLTQQNLGRLLALDRFTTVGPDAGDLACGWVGEGRLIEPVEILAAAARRLTLQSLQGRRVVVTAGPTFEPIDDVRFLGNRSSGKMGFALAEAAARRGADVTLIAGPVALATPPSGGPGGRIVRQDVETAAEMQAALAGVVAAADVVVMASAVSDFRVTTRVRGKLSRRPATATSPAPADEIEAAVVSTTSVDADADADADALSLALTANPDLLAELARSRRGPRPLLVGFAAELASDADDLLKRATRKLMEKRCDIIIANDVGRPDAGFDSDDNAVTLVFSDGEWEALALAPKATLAETIWDRLVGRIPAPAPGRPAERQSESRRHLGAAVRPAASSLTSGTRGRRG